MWYVVALEAISKGKSVRIALSNSSWKWGGVHVVTETLGRALSARGHDVLLLCRAGSELESRMDGIVPHQGIVTGPDLGPVAIARCVGALREHGTQVVLCLMDKDLRITGVAARLRGTPVVVRRANDQPLRTGFQRFCYRRIATKVVANSASTRNTLLASAPSLDAGALSVIHNGVQVDTFRDAPPAALGLPEDALVFGFVGRFETRKGLMELAAAWPRVASAVPEAHLVLVGRGPLEPEIRRRLGDHDRVVFTGHRSDVPSLLRAFDAVVMPSHWEGFGYVAAEAMAAGRAVIASSASSLPELVTDGVTGRLIPPKDADALGSAMIELAKDRPLRERFGREGAATAARDFTIERMVDRWEELLLRVAG